VTISNLMILEDDSKPAVTERLITAKLTASFCRAAHVGLHM